MKFFFDANLSPHLAHGLHELSKQLDDVEVFHLSDLFARNAPDIQWITGLQGGPWVIVSLDKFRKSGGAEKLALKRAGHTVFMLEPQWQKHPAWEFNVQLVRWWPRLVKQASQVSSSILSVPWAPSGKFKASSL